MWNSKLLASAQNSGSGPTVNVPVLTAAPPYPRGFLVWNLGTRPPQVVVLRARVLQVRLRRRPQVGGRVGVLRLQVQLVRPLVVLVLLLLLLHRRRAQIE